MNKITVLMNKINVLMNKKNVLMNKINDFSKLKINRTKQIATILYAFSSPKYHIKYFK